MNFAFSWSKRVLTEKEAPAPKSKLSSSTEICAAHVDKPIVFCRKVLWSRETKTEVSGHNIKRCCVAFLDICRYRSKGEAFKSENTLPAGGGNIMAVLLLVVFIYSTKRTD